MASFDPYHKWLGIPPEQQPPNLYCLLGLPMFESDSDVIDAAAERQTIFLRTFQMGDQAELAEQLLNEVSAARVCLLNPRDKGDYDQTLHTALTEKPMLKMPMRTDNSTSLESGTSAYAVSGQSLHSKPTDAKESPGELTANDDDPLAYSADDIARISGDPSPDWRSVRKQQKPFWQEPWSLPVAAGGVVVVLLLLMLLISGGNESKLSEKPNPESGLDSLPDNTEPPESIRDQDESEVVAEASSEEDSEQKTDPEPDPKTAPGPTATPDTSIENERTLQGHTGIVRGVAYSPDGKWLATGGDDATIRVWDVLEGTHLMTLEGHTSVIRSVAFSPDGKRLVSGAGHEDQDYTARVWDLASRQVVVTQSGHRHRVMSAVFSPDGRKIASGSADGEIKLWDSSTGRETKSWKTETTGLQSIAFSPDGASIASAAWYAEGMDATVKLWYVGTGAELRAFSGKANKAYDVAFSPSGRWVAASKQDHRIKVWDALEGTEVMTLEGHTDSVLGVAFGPHGRQIASASYDQSVRVWDVATGKVVHVFKGHDGRVCNVAFRPDGQQLASVGVDRTVRLWDLEQVRATATTTPSQLAPQLSKLKNINGPGTDAHPWLSPDGLTIYWDRGAAIWTASRSSAGADFEKPRLLIPGRHPTLSGDQLEIIVLAIDDDERPLSMATRSSAENSFGPVRVIEELRNQSSVKSPVLSDDGLTLVFERGIPPKEKRFVISRRNDRIARWTTPQLLPVDRGPYGDEPWTWAFLSQDSLALFCCYGGAKLNRFLVGRRATAGEAFADFQQLQFDNQPVQGRAPRYVKATNELFFSSVPSLESTNSDVWVIKNFHPPGRR